MGGQAIRDSLARLARAIRAVRELTVETSYVTVTAQEPEAGPGHPYRQGSGTLQVRPIATTVLAWDARLGDVVAGPDEAAARPRVVSEVVYEADPVLRELHQENVAAAPAYWVRLVRSVR